MLKIIFPIQGPPRPPAGTGIRVPVRQWMENFLISMGNIIGTIL